MVILDNENIVGTNFRGRTTLVVAKQFPGEPEKVQCFGRTKRCGDQGTIVLATKHVKEGDMI